MFDIVPYFHPEDAWPRAEGHDILRAIYKAKHHVAGYLSPKTIVEVGVRAGYSAAAFLAACPTARYYGIDADVPAHGGIPGFTAWAQRTLPERFPEAAIQIQIKNSLSESWALPFKPDFIHIDGDHTEAGCYQDLMTAYSYSPDWILVDDYTFLADVRRGVDRFLAEVSPRHIILPTIRGDVIIQGKFSV
jgi:hypothetical protein